jgi:hypothetical protein
MRRLFFAGLLASAFLMPTAYAQSAGWQSRGYGDAPANYHNAGMIITGSPPASYVGPGNIVSSATTWGGMRAYSAAAAAAHLPAIRIHRHTDNAETDILLLTNGDLDVATAVSFCATTNCSIATIYDQTGNGNHWAADDTGTFGNDMQLTFSCLGAHPCIVFPDIASFGITAGSVVVAFPWTMAGVANRTALTGAPQVILSVREHGTQGLLGWEAAANTARMDGDTSGSITATAADSTTHSMIGVSGSGSSNSFLTIDGTDTSGTTAGAINGQLLIGATEIGNNNGFKGNFFEVGIWPSAFSGGNRTGGSSYTANAQAYWGY